MFGPACGAARRRHAAHPDSPRTSPGITFAAFGDTCREPTVATRPGCRRAQALHLRNPFRGGRQGVVPQSHGRGAGMIGVACERQQPAALARRSHPPRQRQTQTFQHRALLDVELQIARSSPARGALRADRAGIEPEVANRFAYGDAVGIAPVQQCWSSVPVNARLPMNGKAEAHAFFFGKADDFERQAAAAVSTSAMPSTTPRMPSNAPAFGTVSRCEPIISRGASGCPVNAAQITRRIDAHPHPEPLASSPQSRWTSRIGGERKVRVVRPGSSLIRRQLAAAVDYPCAGQSATFMIPGRCCSRRARAAAAHDSSLAVIVDSETNRDLVEEGRSPACCAEILARLKHQFVSCPSRSDSAVSKRRVRAAIGIGHVPTPAEPRRSAARQRFPPPGCPGRYPEREWKSAPCLSLQRQPQAAVRRPRIRVDAHRVALLRDRVPGAVIALPDESPRSPESPASIFSPI